MRNYQTGGGLTSCGADAHPCVLNHRVLPAAAGGRGSHQPLGSSVQRTNNINMQKTILGLSLSLVVPAGFALFIHPIVIRPNVNEPFSTLVGFGIFWGLAFAVLGFTHAIENRPLATIGWKSLSWKSALMAVGLGFLLSLLVPMFTLLINNIFPQSNSGTLTQVVSNYSWWILLLSVLTAGITEEILFRGYPLERLQEVTGNKWISGLVSLVFFVAVHARFC